MITRISTYAQHQSLLGNVSTKQAGIADLQWQISSGKKAETFDGLPGKVEFVTSLENKMRSAAQYQESNSVIETRLKTMGESIDNVIDIVTDLNQLITRARSAYITEKPVLLQQATSMLRNLSDQLNANLGGRYLFGGTKTDAPPVAEIIGPNVVTGAPDDGYYNGDNETLTARVNDRFEISYGIRANDPAFQELVLAFNTTIKAIEGGNAQGLGYAMDHANAALEGINALQSTINNNIVNIRQANESHSSLQTYWKGIAESETSTDIVAASTTVAIDQAILQASFQTFARISSLKLSDYI